MIDPIELALIYGSTREGRFCDVVARWTAAEISRRADFALRVVDPATMELPARHQRTRQRRPSRAGGATWRRPTPS